MEFKTIPQRCGTWFPNTDHQCEGVANHKGVCQDLGHQGLNTDKLIKRVENAFR
jgi:hypothetical protein